MTDLFLALFEYLCVFLRLFACPLCVFVVCGLFTHLCKRAVHRLLSNGLGFNAVRVTSVVGTPVHELGHVIMCVIFRHKIKSVSWLSLRRADPSLGSVVHTYNKKSLYQRLGLLFIGLGPIFSGLSFILLTMLLCFPDTLSAFFSAAGSVSTGNDAPSVLKECLLALFGIFGDGSAHAVLRLIGAVLILSVCLHLELSSADVKSSAKGLPVYALLVLTVTLIAAAVDLFVKGGASAWLVGTASSLTIFIFALFLPCLCFSAVFLAAALVIRGVTYIFGKR